MPAVWLYHKTNPQGTLYPNLTDVLAASLAAEGWVDTPAKLGPLPPSNVKVVSTTQNEPTLPTAGPGRVLATEPIPAPAWASKLFDQDGDLIEQSIDQRITIIDDMDRAEAIRQLDALGVTEIDEHPVSDLHTSRLRAEIAVRCHIEGVSVSRGGNEETASAVAEGAELTSEPAEDATDEEVAATEGTATRAELRAILDDRQIKWGSRASLGELQAQVDQSNPEN